MGNSSINSSLKNFYDRKTHKKINRLNDKKESHQNKNENNRVNQVGFINTVDDGLNGKRNCQLQETKNTSKNKKGLNEQLIFKKQTFYFGIDIHKRSLTFMPCLITI